MKRIIAMLLTLLMVFTLCACGQSPAPAESPTTGEPAPAAEPEAPAAEEPQDYDYSGQKLVIWTCLTADAQYEVLNKQFTELGNERGVSVEVERLSFNEMIQKLATAASSGDVPDIMHVNFGGTAQLYADEALMPVDGIIDTIGADDFS